MVIRLQHRSMGCSDSSLAPRRKFSALPMANECLFYTLAGTNIQGSSCYAVRQMLSTSGDSKSSSWNRLMPPSGSPASPSSLMRPLQPALLYHLPHSAEGVPQQPQCPAVGPMLA